MPQNCVSGCARHVFVHHTVWIRPNEWTHYVQIAQVRQKVAVAVTCLSLLRFIVCVEGHSLCNISPGNHLNDCKLSNH